MENSSETKPGYQFSIAHLLVFTAIVAASFAPVAWWGSGSLFLSIPAGLIFMLLWVQAFKTAGCFFIFLILVGMLLPNVRSVRPAAERSSCQNNLKQLALGCLNYESEHGHFPPAFSTDENGNPLHSWRVLILPYIEHQALFGDLDLTKPWHHPVNLKFAAQMPAAFKCPSYEPDPDDRFADVMTSYVCVIGKETIWQPDGTPVSFGDLKDGSSNTILLIESDTHRSHWMAPDDPHFDKVHALDEQGTTDLPRSHHNGLAMAVYADGSAHSLMQDLPEKTIRALLTKAGEEIMEAVDF